MTKELSSEEIMEIAQCYNPEYEVVVAEKFIESRRWVSLYSTIVKETGTGKFFEILFEVANTEFQEGSEGDPFMFEVEPYEETIVVTKYKTKE